MGLNRAAMKALPPGKSLSEDGVVFTRMKNGRGRFSVNFAVNGERIHRVVGWEDEGFTVTDARNYAASTRADAVRNRLDLPKGRKLAMRFDEAAASYLERMEQTGGKNLKAKEQHLRLHLVPFFGSLPIDAFESFAIERYRTARRGEVSLRGGARRGDSFVGAVAAEDAPPVSDSTINREIATLSHLLNSAKEWGWLAHRPPKLAKTKERGERIVYLTQSEVARVIQVARADYSPASLPFFMIGIYAGMRMMEILSMRRENVDTERCRIWIPKAKAGRREQVIPVVLARFLEEYMATLPQGEEWLFPSATSKSGHMMDIRTAYKRVVNAAGLDPSRIVRHTLRHTAITHAVQAGVDLPTVQQFAGHASITMTSRYAHANGTHMDASVERLAERLAGKVA